MYLEQFLLFLAIFMMACFSTFVNLRTLDNPVFRFISGMLLILFFLADALTIVYFLKINF